MEIDFLVGKKQLGKIVDFCYRRYGETKTSNMLDNIKRLGFHYSTVGAITISVSDIVIPEAKKEYIQAAEEKVVEIEKKFKRGFLTNKERKENVIKVWSETTSKVTDSLMDALSPNSIRCYMMANSGARGSTNQIRQLAGMRGLMADPSGEIIEIPIRANFREGLTVLEFFISTHGARKGLADTALRTADSGYLTRRLGGRQSGRDRARARLPERGRPGARRMG